MALLAVPLFSALLSASGFADSPAARPPAPIPFSPISPFDTATRHLMAPAGFRPADFNLLVNYRAEIPRTLPAVEALLRRPRSVDSLVPALRAAIARSTSLGAEDVSDPAALWSWIRVAAPAVPLRKAAAAPSLPSVLSLLQSARGADEALRAAYRSLTPEETNFLRRELPGLLVASSEDTVLDPVATEAARLRADALVDSVMNVTTKVKMTEVTRASIEVERIRRTILASVGASKSTRSTGSSETMRLLDSLRDSGIPVTIGTSGSDRHHLDRGIVYDPGGDDRYEFPDTTRPETWLLVIDLDGNDTYLARDSVGAAAAFLSVQVLDDEAGDDRYEGLDLAFGSAVLGFARLIDVAGNDTYRARCAALGYAFQGIGILEDRAGDDTYSTAYLSQGAASTNGLGLLLDESGNDRYVSRPVYPDDLRYRDHFLSMSQGFSTGFAPRYAGGIGVLWDRGGDDRYVADIFGQGTGYWFSWGLLMDDAGNDSLQAYQYAQGAGVHFAAGTLWDGAGNDVRVSKGVSQGCGHDGGFGLLVDARGDDRDSAVDMSAGAGSANGLGIYLDLAGDDVYTMGNPRMTLGHGDMRRDRGSMGFFLDRGGKDRYPEGGGARDDGRAGASWRVYDGNRRGYGYGVDASENDE